MWAGERRLKVDEDEAGSLLLMMTGAERVMEREEDGQYIVIESGEARLAGARSALPGVGVT